MNLIKKVACGMLVAGLAMSVNATEAAAGYYGYQPQNCYYKTVITYEYQTQPVVEWVTKYDHCGKPYQEKVVRHITVKVPVKHVVKVCH